MKKLNVDLGDRSYPIFIGQNIIDQSDYFKSYINGKQVLIVTNETVAPLYLEQLKSALTDFQVDEVILPDGEEYKTLDTVNLIFDALLSKKHNRTTTLIALGGGVVGDMTGFAAASYQRGVDFIQVPTTVLSQVDSSVGGKTGVNHALGKNMIGAFKQPNAVVIDIKVLDTLPERELSAGLAEVIKYGLIGDKDFYHWMLNNTAGLMAKNAELLSEAIYRSCHNKAVVVALDEKEGGIRATLNLGHTYGHAIETDQGYGHWLHGEAVSVGILMAADLSNRLGWISLDEIAELKKFLIECKLPIVAPESMTNDDFIDRMLVDKKVLDGRIRLVLLKEIGEAVVTSDFDIEVFNQGLNSFTA
jgi:3-dehydroquinate synthase